MFGLGEVKTLLLQLLKAVAHMHDNWILHRDLKTSNLLLSHKGILKVRYLPMYVMLINVSVLPLCGRVVNVMYAEMKS